MRPINMLSPFPNWFYEALVQNVRPRSILIKRPPEPIRVMTSTPADSLALVIPSKLKAKQQDFSAVMKDLFDIVVTILLDHRVEIEKVSGLGTLQTKLLKTYLQYILKPGAVANLFNHQGPMMAISFDDMLDLSRRRDETLKKVLSIALKIIYKEFLIKNKINQNLNPRKYVKRNEINRRIFRYYFEREPLLVSRRRCQTYEHSYLFYIKEGVTEEWFEAILGIRNNYMQLSEPKTHFLERIYSILRSENLITMYKRKIVSMVKKVFTVDEGHRATLEVTGVVPEICYEATIKKLEPGQKKPKTALSIEQFKRAVKMTLEALDRFCTKYQIEQAEDLGYHKSTSNTLASKTTMADLGFDGMDCQDMMKAFDSDYSSSEH